MPLKGSQPRSPIMRAVSTTDVGAEGRRIWLLFSLLAALAALAVGCSGSGLVDRYADGTKGGGPREGEPAPVAAATADGVPESTVGAGPATADEGIVEEAGVQAPPFVADPEAGGGSGYEADTVLAVRYGAHERYERVVVDLGAGDAPAGTVPEWDLASPAGDGLLRLTLPSVSATAVSDGKLGGAGEGALSKGFHVVRAPEGGMFVDVYARGAFVYRVLELPDPARLVVDFRATGGSSATPLPAEGGDTVLVEPRRGSRIGDPLTVSGYSRNFEAANEITLTGAGGETLARRTVTGNDWSSTWGYFEATLDLPPFAGRATLKVGATSARDGSFEGVEVPVRGG